MKKILSFSFLLFSISLVFSQNHHARLESIDIMQYIFEIHINDSTDIIEGDAMVLVKFLQPVQNFTIDLVDLDPITQKGMVVESVKVGSYFREFSHENNKLIVEIPGNNLNGTVNVVECNIKYSGIPEDGLIISENKYGDRTFFGDNWPNRAKHWLPTVDHPSDKSPVIFVVYAPEHYKVVSNGALEKVVKLDNSYNKSVWRENVPISTKLMVIGVANFEIGNKETFQEIPVSSWVFPQNQKKGFENYKYGTKALQYFSELIGPYSYEKLAHVQSKTRYGGMENASCIFYHENTGFSDRSQERLFAHEVAHQWFGNSVTEQNWHHVWLSEGFATYLTHVYNQHFHGEEIFLNGLKMDRERVIKYAHKNLAPIIDTTVSEYVKLLNANSYQKASWFLHMLRVDLGDLIFFKGIEKYYSNFQNATALTKDFQNVMETVSGENLDLFFKQWLWQAGHPALHCSWEQEGKKELLIHIRQTQDDVLFAFPLELQIQYKNGTSEIIPVNINKRITEIPISIKDGVDKISLDPNLKLLFEDVTP